MHLPLGISFFTFHAISYVVDIHRHKTRGAKPLDFALYMTLFPHSIAGPIVRYGDIAGQIAHRVVTTAGFAEGIRRFIIGLAKKMLVANTVAVAADAIFALPGRELNFSLAWLGVVCYTLQIYFDFSGYSDMAIGLAKLFGIDFLENFNYPYSAGSITDFWRRWHISLSSWFRDYLYIPLGGNRCWPSAELFQSGDRLLPVRALARRELDVCRLGAVSRRIPGSRADEARPGDRIALVAGAGISTRCWSSRSGWVLFRADTMAQATAFLKAMAGLGTGAGLEYHVGLYIDSQLVLALVAGAIGSWPVLPAVRASAETAWLPGRRAVPGGARRRLRPGRRGGAFAAAAGLGHAPGRGDPQPIHLLPILR